MLPVLRAYCDRTFVLSFFRAFFRLHQRVGKLSRDVTSFLYHRAYY